MPAIKVRIPKADRPFYPKGTLSAGVKARLTEALDSLDQRAAPMVPSLAIPADALTLWVSDSQQAAIELLGRNHGIDGSGPVASGLLHAWASSVLGVATPLVPATDALTVLDRINAAMGDPTREAQAQFYIDIRANLLAPQPTHQVVFAEASTGVGKTRAFLAAIIEWCDANPGECAVVAAPSYNVLLQIIGQWRRIDAVHDTPAAQVIVGQREFVSQHALQRILHECPDTPGCEAARAWMVAGGKPAVDDPMGHDWMTRSLMVATEGEWPLLAEVILDSDVGEDDPGRKAYRQQFADSHEASIVFCTHAMLAVEVRLRLAQATKGFDATTNGAQTLYQASEDAWLRLTDDDRRTSRSFEIRNELLKAWVSDDIGRLPPVGILVVDEAHLLEQNFAAVFASGASMARLMRDLRELHNTVPRAVRACDMESMRSIWQELREIGTVVGTDRLLVKQNAALGEAVASVRKLLTAIMARLPKHALTRPETRHLRSVALALEVAVRAAGERTGMTMRISWSPSVQWPSIEVGRYDVSRELDFLWAVVVRQRTIVVSATLYDDVSLAGIEGIRRILAVRTAFVCPVAPVRPAWLYEPVTLYLAGNVIHADGLSRFRRPTQNDHLDALTFADRAQRWRSDVAGYIALAYKSAAGGMLVLLTSHAEREELLSRIEDAIPADCLLTQSEGRSLDGLRHAFLEATAAGRRPCLIAVGAAWTGLDLSGDGLSSITGSPLSPNEDNVLTDLVIPIAPIGTNRSLTHEWRRERTGMIAEIGATAIAFRQGIGRLVRREGLPHNRRIHFLDARIYDAQWAWMMKPLLRTLLPYTRRRSV